MDSLRPSTNCLVRFPHNIGILKEIFMKAHYCKLQFFGQPMCENRLTFKSDSWFKNKAGKSLGKLYPTNYLAAIVVVYLHERVMKHKHQKMKKKGKQYLIKQVAFTERGHVGCLLFSPMFTCGLFIIMLLQT